jgi:hypothetical protein
VHDLVAYGHGRRIVANRAFCTLAVMSLRQNQKLVVAAVYVAAKFMVIMDKNVS